MEKKTGFESWIIYSVAVAIQTTVFSPQTHRNQRKFVILNALCIKCISFEGMWLV
jgi:hypothetical protein